MGNLPVSTQTISNLNVDDGGKTFDSFYFGTTFNAFFVAPSAFIFTALWETYFRFYMSFLEVFLFPIWFITAIDKKWNI